MIELKGRQLGTDASVAADYASLREGAAAIDLSDRGRMRFTGIGAKDALNGVLTCDLAPLTSGEGVFGAALTSKGKVIADLSVFANDDSLLVECSPSAWPGWKQLVTKYINPRMAKHADETDATGALGLFGADASRVIAGLTGIAKSTLDALPMYGHVAGPNIGDVIDVARIPDLGVDGYRILVKRTALHTTRTNAILHGARVIGVTAIEAARIEAGRPVWGLDMDDSTLPQEVNLESLGAISFTKGCYTGQEVVARIHFRGHVNRRLMGLRIEGSALPAHGSELTSLEGSACGDVRSSVISPRFGVIALAMVRREVDAGAPVTLRIADQVVRAEVAALPFVG